MGNYLFKDSPEPATEKDCKARWSGGKPGENFKCAFCAHKFEIDDLWTGVYTNDIRGASGNPLSCEKCWNKFGGREGLRQKWIKINREFNTISEKYWYFIRDLHF